MPNPELFDYEDDNLVGGEVRTANKDVAAGTYWRGEPLGRLIADLSYVHLDTNATNGEALWTGTGAADVVLAAPGKIPVYVTGSELQAVGIVDSNGSALAMTAALVENAQDRGTLIKLVKELS